MLLRQLKSTIVIAVIRYIMEKVDLILVGAEGVVESGGIINKVRNSHSYTYMRFLRELTFGDVFYCVIF